MKYTLFDFKRLKGVYFDYIKKKNAGKIRNTANNDKYFSKGTGANCRKAFYFFYK